MKRRRPIIEPVAPARGAGKASTGELHGQDEPLAPLPASHSLAPSPQSAAPLDAPDSLLDGLSAFAAQLLGQGGRKRGLKGGPPVLEAAKSAYLEAEYSGSNDRRARTGRIAKTDI